MPFIHPPPYTSWSLSCRRWTKFFEPEKLPIDLTTLRQRHSGLTQTDIACQHDALRRQTQRLSRDLYNEVVDAPDGRSPFAEAWAAQGDKTAPGINPTYKLRVRRLEQCRRHREIQRTYYSISRLLIVEETQRELAETGFTSTLATILTMFRREGVLSLPLSVRDADLKFIPDQPYSPCTRRILQLRKECCNFPICNDVLGYQTTFTLARCDSRTKKCFPGEEREMVFRWEGSQYMYVREVRKWVGDRRRILANPNPGLMWLRKVKEGAVSLFLLLMGGLDFYQVNPSPPDDRQPETAVEDVFSYNYARNRLRSGLEGDFNTLRQEGREVFRSICPNDVRSFVTGTYEESSLVCALDRGKKRHVLPMDAIAFSTVILTEAMVRWETLRRESLICDQSDPGSEPWLPPGVARLRYNGWDVYFVLWVLDVLDFVLHGDPITQLERNQKWWNKAVRTANEKISEFQRSQDLNPSEKKRQSERWKRIRTSAPAMARDVMPQERAELPAVVAKLRDKLRDFIRQNDDEEYSPENYIDPLNGQGVWTVLGKWLNEGDEYYLRKRPRENNENEDIDGPSVITRVRYGMPS